MNLSKQIIKHYSDMGKLSQKLSPTPKTQLVAMARKRWAKKKLSTPPLAP